MNTLWKRMLSFKAETEKPKRTPRPYTIAFTNEGLAIGSGKGIMSFENFPTADVLNIIHKNNKVTVIKK